IHGFCRLLVPSIRAIFSDRASWTSCLSVRPCRAAVAFALRKSGPGISRVVFTSHCDPYLWAKSRTADQTVRPCEPISRLDFGASPYLYRSVPTDDQVTSLTGVGGSAQNGAVAFTTTHWSVVLAAQGESPEANAALEKLCRTYWRPIYGFVRRQGYKLEEAQDFTQGFFALLLERKDLNAVRKEKGRLRSYLLTSVKHFL